MIETTKVESILKFFIIFRVLERHWQNRKLKTENYFYGLTTRILMIINFIQFAIM